MTSAGAPITSSDPTSSSNHSTLSSPDLPKLRTAHGHFLLPPSSPSLPSPSVLLRGVNLSSSSKFPPFPPSTPKPTESREERDRARLEDSGWRTDIPAQNGWWEEAENGGREGWFVGRPLKEDEADVHFMRLKAWGFTTIRWIIPWEALEHAGPGKYDEAYIEYTIRLMRKAKLYGFRVYISPHQDIFSRFTGGSGAPYWVLVACGISPRRVHQTGSAILQSQWTTKGSGGEEGRETARKGETGDYPDMIWNSNTGRLAARHCFTMFWASEEFAPKCKIDGEPLNRWLQRHHVAAYAYLAKRLQEPRDLLDSCVIGWDSLNEPHEGFIEIPDLGVMPEVQQFRKGPSPTPIQGFKLAIGQSVSDIEDADFGSLGLKKKGKVTLTPPGGEGLWLTRDESKASEKLWGWTLGEEWDFWGEKNKGCIWAGHGVWEPKTGHLLKKDYFHKNQNGREYKYIDDFWKPAHINLIRAIRQYHPAAISLINPPIFAEPPNLDQSITGERAALSAHFYDGLTMMAKRRHLFNADTVGLQRGTKSMLRALKIGDKSIRDNFRNQLNELQSDASKTDGIAGNDDSHEYPTIIGEMGTPWDLKTKSGLLGMAKGEPHRSDYAESAKAMDQMLGGCDGPDALSYTLWTYEPLNTHEHGDGWNGEDLSLFSFADIEGDDDLLAASPPDLYSLIMLGARGIQSWCRPYPLETCGVIRKFEFDMSSRKFELVLDQPGLEDNPLVREDPSRAGQAGEPLVGYTKIYLPYAHYVATAPRSDREPARRLTGEADPDGQEWIKGHGPARVDLELVELSEGDLKIEGQWATWTYELRRKGGREVKLVQQGQYPPLISQASQHPSVHSQLTMPTETRQTDRVQKYAKRWDKDSSKDTDAHKQSRLDEYTEVVNGYYDGATELYEFGWAESFHFSRFFKGEGLLQSLARHEHYLAHQLGLQADMRVLDVGCGVGGPAREICRFTDANITGLNNNDFQIGRANLKTRKQGLSEKVNFAKGDFMKLGEQFGEGSFDAVYAIEATVHAPTFEGVYGEIFKVLKPGGKFGVYEWCMTDAWDPSNPEHKKISHGIEVGDGIAEMRNVAAARKALKSVGFEILHEEDLAERADHVPWYYPLEGDLFKAQTWWDLVTCFRTSKFGRRVTQNSVWCLEKARLVPKGTYDVGETLVVAADNLVAGGRTKLFTPMMLFIAQKPAN